MTAMIPGRRRAPRSDGVGDERGYVIVEAALALPLYVLFMFAVLQLSTFAIAQAKVTVAVNQTAIELSQYSYVMSGEAGKNSKKIIGWLDSFIGKIGGSADIMGSADSENPLVLMVGSTGGNDRVIAENMLRKHLKQSDASLRSMGLVDGADGVRVSDSSTVLSGDQIVLDVEYDLRLSFLIERDVTMRAYATTARWGE